jgi:NADPH:quinone reductase-like Zn-dependent oxidoreductase
MEYPKTNKALRFTTIGGDLNVTETDVSPLRPTEILVKVHAASINPVDIQLWRSGLVGVVAGEKGMGRDFSGTVVSVGSNVQGWSEGDEIFGLLFRVVSRCYFPSPFHPNTKSRIVHPNPSRINPPLGMRLKHANPINKFGEGTFSQYIKVNPQSDSVAKKPTSFTHEEAASVPLVALTAFACLDWLPPMQGTQRRVIVRGASGGTGSWIVQRKRSPTKSLG